MLTLQASATVLGTEDPEIMEPNQNRTQSGTVINTAATLRGQSFACVAIVVGRGLPFRTSAPRVGVPSKADIVSNLRKGGCVNLRTRGEGVKKSEFFADVLNGSPQLNSGGDHFKRGALLKYVSRRPPAPLMEGWMDVVLSELNGGSDHFKRCALLMQVQSFPSHRS